MPSSDLRLIVDGAAYGGWMSVDINRGVDRMAGTFQLSVSELWPDQKDPREIPVGARCEVLIDGEPVITGWIDEVAPAYAGKRKDIRITGRDAAGDLVDCSAEFKTGSWSNATILQIARDLCAPFGIKVRATTDVGKPFDRGYRVEAGETVHECLARAAKQRGLLMMSDGLGGLVIARAGKERVTTGLVLGENIIAGSGKRNHRDRFSRYTVVGNSDIQDGDVADYASGLSGVALDGVIKRHRPLKVNAEYPLDLNTAKERAIWERNVRAGRSLELTYTVPGWRHKTGLWVPDRLVPIRDSFMRVERDLYISGVNYKLDDAGTVTELTVTLPEAYTLIPLPEKEDVIDAL